MLCQLKFSDLDSGKRKQTQEEHTVRTSALVATTAVEGVQVARVPGYPLRHVLLLAANPQIQTASGHNVLTTLNIPHRPVAFIHLLRQPGWFTQTTSPVRLREKSANSYVVA